MQAKSAAIHIRVLAEFPPAWFAWKHWSSSGAADGSTSGWGLLACGQMKDARSAASKDTLRYASSASLNGAGGSRRIEKRVSTLLMKKSGNNYVRASLGFGWLGTEHGVVVLVVSWE